jgi:apolipoprotein N-acyltransferase
VASSGSTLRAVAAGTLSALALFFGTGLQPGWPLIWIAPVPVLIAAHEGGRARAAALGFVAWFAGGLNVWSFLRGTLGMPLPIVLVLMAVPALAFAFALLLSQALLRRNAVVPAVLAVPALWVSFEYVLSLTSPHGTYGNIAYTQGDLLPVVQLASVTGIWGISFLVLLVPTAAAVAFHVRRSRQAALRLVACVGVIVAVAVTWGAQRLRPRSGGTPIEVALLATDGGRSRLPSGDEGLRLVEEYANRIASLPPDGARILVLPEKIAQLDGARLARASEILSTAAARARVTLIAGLQQTDPEPRVLALVVGPEGRPLGTYVKHHLLPPFESENIPGRETLILDGSPRWGVQICKDMDFPALSRRYAASGVGLLAVPAWDFVQDGWLHSRMAVIRGVEGGFTIVRTAREGLLTVSDDRGRIVAEKASRAEFGMLTATVEALDGGTLYGRLGDWFAWLSLLILATCLTAWRWMRRASKS